MGTLTSLGDLLRHSKQVAMCVRERASERTGFPGCEPELKARDG